MDNALAEEAPWNRMSSGHLFEYDVPVSSLMDPVECQVLSNIAQYGWHVILIPEDDEGPAFAYSIGLHKSFNQPEVIVFGLPLETMHRIINVIGELARACIRLQDHDSSSDVLEGYDVVFRRVGAEHYREFFGYARRYYKGNNFPAVQCIWPDAEGRYPWDARVPQSLKNRQPGLWA